MKKFFEIASIKWKLLLLLLFIVSVLFFKLCYYIWFCNENNCFLFITFHLSSPLFYGLFIFFLFFYRTIVMCFMLDYCTSPLPSLSFLHYQPTTWISKYKCSYILFVNVDDFLILIFIDYLIDYFVFFFIFQFCRLTLLLFAQWNHGKGFHIRF